MKSHYDAIVIGGGFYGCAVAQELARSGKRVKLLEKEPSLMQHASYVNQARIHQGYHYPRSVLTALRSRVNFERFVDEYADCVYSSFDKYYAIGKLSSRINAEQFRIFCQRIGAPIEKAEKHVRNLFNPNLIEDVFKVKEYAFNAVKLCELMLPRLSEAGVEIACSSRVESVRQAHTGLEILYQDTADTHRLSSTYLFNCTYSAINQVLQGSSLQLIPLKHEMTEMALVKVPEEVKNMGITVMDGPFFSIMPFPARGLHSLSHVRYTPHHYWQDDNDRPYLDATARYHHNTPASHHLHMLKDAQRYMPILADCSYKESLWEIKTVLPQSEVDDSRPILFRRSDELYNVYSVMGGKIDNIFDIREKLADLFRQTEPAR